MSPRVLIVENAVHPLVLRSSLRWKAALGDVAGDIAHAASGLASRQLDGYTHLILGGSETSLLRPRPWIDGECRLIREATRRGIPILGSCFGHQILVYALSGPQAIRCSETPEVGWTPVDVVLSDELLADVPRPWHAFCFHLDEVADPPPPWKVLARSARCAVHAVRYGDRPVWGIQAHPEIPGRGAGLLACAYLLASGASPRALAKPCGPAPRGEVVRGIVRRFLAARGSD